MYSLWTGTLEILQRKENMKLATVVRGDTVEKSDCERLLRASHEGIDGMMLIR